MDLTTAIDDAFRAKSPEPPRAYVGASSVGNACNVYLALSHRGFPDTENDPQLMRIFRDGHRIEDQAIEDLRMAGFLIKTRNHDSKQYEFVNGPLKAHVDGIIVIDQQDHILEIKSMNDTKFKKFKTSGVRVSHPNYYVQCQVCMGLSGIYRCVLVAYCKNNSQYHHEYIEFDAKVYDHAVFRSQLAADGDVKRIGDDPDDSECRFCFKRTSCWEPSQMFIKQICRTCIFASGDQCEIHGSQHEPCLEWEVWRP